MRSVETEVTVTPSSRLPLPRITPSTHCGVMSFSDASNPSPDVSRSTMAIGFPFSSAPPGAITGNTSSR